MKPTREQIQALAHMSLATRPKEITCDDWLHLVGRCVELEVAGEPVPPSLEPVRDHLRICGPCMEELEALKRAMSGD